MSSHSNRNTNITTNTTNNNKECILYLTYSHCILCAHLPPPHSESSSVSHFPSQYAGDTHCLVSPPQTTSFLFLLSSLSVAHSQASSSSGMKPYTVRWYSFLPCDPTTTPCGLSGSPGDKCSIHKARALGYISLNVILSGHCPYPGPCRRFYNGGL